MSRNLADALIPAAQRRKPKKPRKLYARIGEVVTCELGHVIAVVAVPWARADDEIREPFPVDQWLRDFGPFQSKGKFLDQTLKAHKGPAHRDLCCGVCGQPYAKFMYTRRGEPKGIKWHFQDEGWRPKRQRRKRRAGSS